MPGIPKLIYYIYTVHPTMSTLCIFTDMTNIFGRRPSFSVTKVILLEEILRYHLIGNVVTHMS